MSPLAPLARWGVEAMRMSVRSFLEAHDLAEFFGPCEAQRITLDDLREMSDDDLIEVLGMGRFVDRRRVRAALGDGGDAAALDDGATRFDSSRSTNPNSEPT